MAWRYVARVAEVVVADEMQRFEYLFCFGVEKIVENEAEMRRVSRLVVQAHA